MISVVRIFLFINQKQLKMKTNFFGALLMTLAFSVGAFSQTKGKVVDQSTNEPLVGAHIHFQTEATTTGLDGEFELKSAKENDVITISYIGYEKKQYTINGDNVVISLESETNSLQEVVVVGKGIIDVSHGRKTPIAVSTIKAAEIQSKIGTNDVTQTLVNTPSVYVAGQSGGFGDSRISVRGFQQDNTAFLLNGQPINGMEDGKMYWSNWSGMGDIANAVQIQRGLGSSKLAISSVGGTVNFVTKTTDKKEGGFVSTGTANDNYLKTTVAYSTGLLKNGLSVTTMFSHWQGDGFNDGTQGAGQNYFISLGYKLNEKHNFNFLITGAPQWHNQNFSKKISDYLGFGRRYNNNYGYLNGKFISERVNFYHKPVANINWDYKISEKTNLSTVLYASWGRGGGTGNYGASANKKFKTELNPYTNQVQNTYIDYDQIYANNSAIANGAGTFANSYLIRSSMNNHSWYGVVSNLNTKLNKNLNLNFGIDLRTYDGTHYRQVNNFLGLTNFTDSRKLRGADHQMQGSNILQTVTESYSTNPWSATFNGAGEEQRIDYDYSETITYGGVFGQLEYSKDNFSAFVQGSLSNQTHQRFDRYDYLPEFEKSDKVENLGYNLKAGGSYTIDDKHSFYVNTGLYSRQPYHDNIYLNFTNEVNPLTSNEKIFGLESGYTFKSKLISGSINAYRTSWKDRVVSSSRVVTLPTETIGTTVLTQGDLVYKSNLGVEQIHSGVEVDFIVKPTTKLDIKGFASIGNWEYKSNSITRQTDENQNLLSETLVDVDGGKVGDAAQTTWGLGVKYDVLRGLSIDTDWRTYDKLYSSVGAVKENLLLPTYDLVDAGVSYKMFIGKNKKDNLTLRLNVNNVFDEVYLSELRSNVKTTDNLSSTNPSLGTYQSNGRVYNGIADGNQGYFGLGRTWNVSLRYNF
jgi:iron complex outermembrane recepter protein